MESVQDRMKRLGAYEKIASFMQKEKQDYSFKRKYAQIRAEEFRSECDRRGLNCHVSVGGLDSIILYMFIHEVCHIDVPGVSASTLEDASIQRVHKAIGIINVPPLMRDDGTRWTKPIIPFHIPHFWQQYLPAYHSALPDQQRGWQPHHLIGSWQVGRRALKGNKGLNSFAWDHQSGFIYFMRLR